MIFGDLWVQSRSSLTPSCGCGIISHLWYNKRHMLIAKRWKNRHSLQESPLVRTCAVCVFLLLAIISCANKLPYRATYRIVQQYPHDPAAFTQGLVFDGDTLYEGTGLKGESSLRHVDLERGEVVQIEHLAPDYFGEGVTVWKDQIIQLTWKSERGFVYDKETFGLQRTFSYEGEGWGLTHDGKRLIMSDGSSWLRFLDPETLNELGRVQVLDQGEPVTRLNELEWVRGQVWANVWQSPQIVRIDAETGTVLGWIDFTSLVEREPNGVLNGIAVRNGDVFVTGKRWSHIYEVEIIADE